MIYPHTLRWSLGFHVFLLVELLTTLTVSAISVRECQLNLNRLPQRIKPTHYKLLINPDLNKLTYEGHVKVDVAFFNDPKCLYNNEMSKTEVCDEKRIFMSAKRELKLLNAQYNSNLVANESNLVNIVEVCHDTKLGFISILLDRPIRSGSVGQIKLKFVGYITNGPYGFYKSPYISTNNQEASYVLTTLIWPSSVFPCFEDPQFRATFSVIIEHDSRLEALSNMEPVKHESVISSGGTRVRTHFAKAPMMSAYLLGFAIGEFDHIKTLTSDGKLLINIDTPPGKGNRGEFALDIAKRAYEALVGWLEVEQPIRKIDLVPFSNHEPAAVANWGMITFNQQVLLPSSEIGYGSRISSIVTIIHELTHLWFGNLVQSKWFDSLWMNEGFAEYFSYFFANELYPEHNFALFYLMDSFSDGISADVGEKNHPIKNTSMIGGLSEAYDTITYKKGGAIIRMLCAYIGKDKFRIALKTYLERYKFGLADEMDLISILEEVSGLSVEHLAQSWLKQAGHPLLFVEFANQDQNKLKITQRTLPLREESKDKIWIIPITMVVSDNDKKTQVIKFVLQEKQPTSQVLLPNWFSANKGHWFKLNVNSEGFYQVNYEEKIMNNLKVAIQLKKLNPADRLNILLDLYIHYNNRIVDYARYSEILEWFEHENHPAVISVLSHHIRSLFGNTNSKLIKILTRFYENNGRYSFSSEESLLLKLAKSDTLISLIWLNQESIIDEGVELFQSSDNDIVTADNILPLLASVARRGSTEQLQRACEILKSLEYEKDRIELLSYITIGISQERRAKLQLANGGNC